MGGTSCRPPIRRSKIGKSNLGVHLRPRSNLLYGKLLTNDDRAPAGARKTGVRRRTDDGKHFLPQPRKFLPIRRWKKLDLRVCFTDINIAFY